MNLLKNIKRILGKTSQSSQENTNKMDETVMADKQQKMYQWIKGDKFGTVVTVAEDQKDGKWLYFEDGSRINPSLVHEYLMEVENEKEVLKVAEELTTNPDELITPQAILAQDQTPTPVNSAPVKEPTIMGNMIMKMSKKNVVNVPLQINLNIPTPEIYAMLSGGMEVEDLNEEIMEVALQQIEINNLTEYLKENISTFLSEYYS